MQHSLQPAHRSRISCHGAILALAALLVSATGKPVGAASDDSNSGKAETYTGIFIGSGLAGNRIVDIEGFANWGQPGYRLDYGDNRRLDFGWSHHTVNHSGNNRCGPGNPRRPCPYKVRNRLGIVRFGLIHRFGP